MKTKLSQVVNTYAVLKSYATLHCPIKFGYFVAKNLARMQVEVDLFESKRKELQDKYFITVDGVATEIPDKKDELDAEWKATIDMEVDVEPYMIKLINLENVEPKLSPEQLQILMWLIDEE